MEHCGRRTSCEVLYVARAAAPAVTGLWGAGFAVAERLGGGGGNEFLCSPPLTTLSNPLRLHLTPPFQAKPFPSFLPFHHALHPVPTARKALGHADIAILDQNIDFPQKTFLGTDIVEELLSQGFGGLLCIRSANTADHDVALYKRSGAHCVLSKEFSGEEMIRSLVEAWTRHSAGISLLSCTSRSMATFRARLAGANACCSAAPKYKVRGHAAVDIDAESDSESESEL